MEKLEIITNKRDEKIGGAFAAIQMGSDDFSFYNYGLVADHDRGRIEFSTSDYKIIATKGRYFEDTIKEILEAMKMEKEKEKL